MTNAHQTAAEKAERRADSYTIGMRLAQTVGLLARDGSRAFAALGFDQYPEFAGKNRTEIVALLGRAAEDLAFSAEWARGDATNQQSLANQAHELEV